MVSEGAATCPICGGELKNYDTVRRIVRTKNRQTRRIYVRRLRCSLCGKIHRALPYYIYPFKQYEKELIDAVLSDLITADTLGFEDYPCEATMALWKKHPPTYSFLG